ncbi:Snf7-domain-containing protein [Durotheca rogersii]|uniref:Snf7-domain-containing protein n=1 Tax=Durotheca rogersii TaxID=419775 RepID=UPI0022205AC4|nr:Snf7-domain-containing protein [Durotheca rogersii]KAI5861577.1 Snf7-domain-containing protein [Durotheca rogersii]
MGELIDYLVQNDKNFRRARLPALYSDFRSQRTLNPDGFAANVAAWKRGLSEAALAGHAPSKSATHSRLILDVEDDALMRSLETKQFGRPLALGTALQDAVANGEMMPLQQFLAAKDSIYSKSWANLPWSIVSWGLRQVGIGGPGDSLPKGQFVVLHNLEVTAKAFNEAAADRTSPFERTFSKTHFQKTFGDTLLERQKQSQEQQPQPMSELDLEVLVRFLSRDKNVLVTDGNTVRIVRAAAADEAPTITEEDAAVASLKELTEDLSRQADALTRRVEDLRAAALDATRRKNRTAALAALRSKKIAEATLERRHATLAQLEDVAAKIEQAADSVQAVRVLRASAGALRGLNARVGGADAVADVMDELRAQVAEVDEVGALIADAGPAGAVDEAEVDDEFEALLAQERAQEEAAARREREAEEERQAEETRNRLAQLDRLPPAAAALVREEDGRPITPVTAAAGELEGVHLGK